MKIYPIKSKDSSIDVLNFKNINFIAAGGLSINDVKTYKSLGYKAIVIGDKAIKNKKFDPKIYEWLKCSLKEKLQILKIFKICSTAQKLKLQTIYNFKNLNT